jgi:uncharacterized membrane protein YqjE
MADQATVNGNGGPPASGRDYSNSIRGASRPSVDDKDGASPGQVMSSVAGFGENLLNLAELQTRLAAVELRQNVDNMKTAGAVVVVGLVVALGAFPLLLAAGAELLVSELGWRRGYAFLAVASCAIGLGTFLAAAASLWLRRQRVGFPLSTEEFTRNLNWVHTVLRFSGRQPSRGG